MSEDTYDLADIADKRNFADHLQVESPFEEPFFEENEKLLTVYMEHITQTDQPEELVTDLTSENPKGIIVVPDSYFHYFSDYIGPIYVFLNNCIKNNINKVEVIGVILEPDQQIVKNFNLFLQHCLQSFSNRIEVIYKETNENSKLSDFDKGFLKVNKSRIIDQQDIGISMEFLYEMAKTFSDYTETSVPDKKVFVSRRLDTVADNSENRNLYEQECEEFFASIGFEVISAESFESLRDQINYFNNVSVFASFSGSGLTSAMFMKPEQTVIEIVCPIKFSSSPQYEIHNFYKTISMLKKHTYVGVSNINNTKESLLGQLDNIAKML
jgi:hypothetical protein